MTNLVLILLGAPGTGKGTQANLLKDRLHLPHISTGDLLRENVRRQTPLGVQAKGFIDKGHLVPDPLILEMLFGRLGQPDCQKGYILDGFPRTVPQAQALSTFLQTGLKPVVINLDLSSEKILERLSLRLSCSHCGQPYHALYAPPAHPGICDKCGSPLTQRHDDTKEVITERLKVYRNQTAPLIDFYTSQGVLHTIECSSSKEEVLSRILTFI